MQPTNKPLLTSTCTDTTVLSISALLYASCSSGNVLNEMCWSSFKNHIFDVKSSYKAFSGGLKEVLPWQVILKTKVPWKVSFFALTDAHGNILTTGNLQKGKIIIFNWYGIVDGEYIAHLFLHFLLLGIFGLWFSLYLVSLGSCVFQQKIS